MQWDSSNTSFELGISSSFFNVIRFVVTAVVLASASQLLLDWLVSEARIHALANGRDVNLSGGPSFRFLRTTSSGVSQKWLHIVLVLLIYAAEVAIEFGSSSTTTGVLQYETKQILQRTALQAAPQCLSLGQASCFPIEAVGHNLPNCTEMNDLGLEWKFTAKRTEIIGNSSQLELVCPMTAVGQVSATRLLYASERRANLMKGVFYRKVHRGGPSTGNVMFPGKSGPKESLVHARITSLGTTPAFSDMQVSNGSRLALLIFMDVTLRASNATARIFCDPHCLTSRCDFLFTCFMISQNKSQVLLYGAIRQNGNNFEKFVTRMHNQSVEHNKLYTIPVKSRRALLFFLPVQTVEMTGLAYSYYPSLISMIFPVMRSATSVGNLFPRYLAFLAVNGKYELPAVTRRIPTRMVYKEQGTIGPIFVAGVLLYAVVIIFCVLLALWHRTNNRSVGITWFTGESRFAAQWADSEARRGNSLKPSGDVVVRLEDSKPGRHLTVV